ncbi:1-phosphatidylinositol 4,5-bisphosphate phosphodiesterase delta-4 [Irineochytrium annulatum]|nr:1-phosphatidylinositol 4,5-bisphosphate phosphodiesterase delta-4 [Irineochytrium annulatum]
MAVGYIDGDGTITSRSKYTEFCDQLRPSIKEVDPAYVEKAMSADKKGIFHLLDVREVHEWNSGFIPHAVYTGRGCLERDIEHFVPDPYDEIVLYCGGGNRSLIAADAVKRMGYKNVMSLKGGISGWISSGRSVTKQFKTFSGEVRDKVQATGAGPPDDAGPVDLASSSGNSPSLPVGPKAHPLPAMADSPAAPEPSPPPSSPSDFDGSNNLLPTPPSISGRESPVDSAAAVMASSVDAAEAIQNILLKGTRMLKYPNKASSKPEERVIRVDLLPLQMSWESKKKKSALSTADIQAIREIRLGQNTKAFEIHGKLSEADDRAFSIIYVAGGKYKMLNLGLHILLAQADGDSHHRSMGSWLRGMWGEIDKKGKGTLDLDEVTALMKRLNVRLSKVEVKSTFKNADISKRGYITYDNFERLYRMLRFRPEIGQLFSSLAKTDPSSLTYEEFERFVMDVQKMSWTPTRCMEVYRKYCPAEPDLMDMDHFSAFLISANNAICKKKHTDVYQDMTRPLCDYFINSSHNTTGRILFKDAIDAINRYAFVSSPYPLFLSLELHCSPDQQLMMAKILTEVLGTSLLTAPLSEGETELPSPAALKYKILLKSKTIPPDAVGDEFEYETEDDDGVEVEARDSQPRSAPTDGVFGSPSLLRHKTLNKKSIATLSISSPNLANASLADSSSLSSSTSVVTSSATSSPISAAGDFAAIVALIANPAMSPTQAIGASTPSSESPLGLPQKQYPVGASSTSSTLTRKKSSMEDMKIQQVVLHQQPQTQTAGAVTKKGSPLNKRRFQVARGLSDLVVYCKSVRFTTTTIADALKFDEMVSLSESKALSFLGAPQASVGSGAAAAPLRVNSSNPDPAPLWSAGCQMVAMNFQTFDRGMQLNQALFAGNGRCGFFLKPETVRKFGSGVGGLGVGYTPSESRKSVLTVTLISAHQLPKAKEGGAGTVTDPYVDIEVVNAGEADTKYRTKAISGSGGIQSNLEGDV